MYIQLEPFIISFIITIPIVVGWVYLIDQSKKMLEEDDKEETDTQV